jgi:hypothetical protein
MKSSPETECTAVHNLPQFAFSPGVPAGDIAISAHDPDFGFPFL